MTTTRSLQTPLSQQVLSLGLAALVTVGALAGVLGLAAPDQDALMAQMARQAASAPQAIAAVLVLPTA
jgi:hypothetical protein